MSFFELFFSCWVATRGSPQGHGLHLALLACLAPRLASLIVGNRKRDTWQRSLSFACHLCSVVCAFDFVHLTFGGHSGSLHVDFVSLAVHGESCFFEMLSSCSFESELQF